MTVPPILPVAERLTAIIVDEKEQNRRNLTTLLKECYPQVRVIAQVDSILSARALVALSYPDLLFLDVQMSRIDSQELLVLMQEHELLTVLVASHDRYNITSVGRIKQAMAKAVPSHKKRTSAGSLSANPQQILLVPNEVFKESLYSQRIVFPTEKGFLIEELRNIVRLQSKNNYVTVVRNGLKSVVLSKSLKDFEGILDEDQFVRVHNSHIVNMDYMKEYEHRAGGYLVLEDGSKVPVSRRRHNFLLEKIKRYRFV